MSVGGVRMCELDAMIYSDARHYNISIEQIEQLHEIYHSEHGNGNHPKTLIDLLEVLT